MNAYPLQLGLSTSLSMSLSTSLSTSLSMIVATLKNMILSVLLMSLVISLVISGLANAIEFNPVPGGLALVRIAGNAQPKPSAAYFGSRRIPVIEHVNAWHALIGVRQSQTPGRYVIHYVTDENKIKPRGFRVKPHKRPEPEIDALQQPERSGLFYLSRELEDLISSTATKWRDTEQFTTQLTLPVQGTITATYGKLTSGRVNNSASYAQKGLEIKTLAFNPVNATADAKVIGVITQQVHGHTLILDHGQSLMSVLIGVASPLVSVDQFVSLGESVGQAAANAVDEGQASSDATNVSTILWRVYLNGNAIDPQAFLR